MKKKKYIKLNIINSITNKERLKNPPNQGIMQKQTLV